MQNNNEFTYNLSVKKDIDILHNVVFFKVETNNKLWNYKWG